MQFDSEVLSRYAPDPWKTDPREYIKDNLLDDSHIHRGQLPSRSETAYISDYPTTRTGIAIHDVIQTIDWHDIPINYPALEPPSSQYDADEREHVRWYTRVRNAICHADLLEFEREPEPAIAEELNRMRGPPEGSTHEDVLDTLAATDAAPSIREETHLVYDTAEKALRNKARAEGRSAATKWELQEDELPLTVLADEVMFVVESARRTYVGGQTDRVAHLHEYDAPGVVEIKVTEILHPSHILQAETARRAVTEVLDEEAVGVVLRITPNGDYEILTSEDEGWPREEAWDWVCRRSRIVYDELEPHLETAARRLL